MNSAEPQLDATDEATFEHLKKLAAGVTRPTEHVREWDRAATQPLDGGLRDPAVTGQIRRKGTADASGSG